MACLGSDNLTTANGGKHFFFIEINGFQLVEIARVDNNAGCACIHQFFNGVQVNFWVVTYYPGL